MYGDVMVKLCGSKQWEVLAEHKDAEKRLQSSFSLDPLVAHVMAANGFDANDSDACKRAEHFLHPDLARDWLDPFIIPNMRRGAQVVADAIRADKNIAIFGDFDVDGMSATCLLTLALRRLGAQHVRAYIPHRFDEGYGLSQAALQRVIEDQKPDLIITVDNGIAAAPEVAWLLEHGIDVVITDHHEPADLVPVGVPVIDPKMQPDNPSRELAGVGVALKLVDVLGAFFGMPNLWREYVEVACLGTISDMMLLQGENRSLVAEGIRRLRTTGWPGIVALCEVCSVKMQDITADSLPFSLIPRLNAAGRMGNTDVALDLLLTNDLATAFALAHELEDINTRRREIEQSLTEEAMAMAEAMYTASSRVIVIAGEGWHEGVKGIVASRIVACYHVPTLLFSISDGVARGSGRSVGSVDLFAAVNACSDLLLRFGGHAGAVGVTLEAVNINALRVRLEQELSKLDAQDFVSTGEVCAFVSLEELTMPSIASLETLQPFGRGNTRPLFALRAVCMRGRCRVGAQGEHLRFYATDGLSALPAIMFRTPRVQKALDCDEAVDLVFDAVNETWQGHTKPKLMVRDIVYHVAPSKVADTGENTAVEKPIAEKSDAEKPVSIVDELFSETQNILARKTYAGIAEATSFVTHLSCATTPAARVALRELAEGQVLQLRCDEHSTVEVYDEEGELLGSLKRHVGLALAPLLAAGAHYDASVLQITEPGEQHAVAADEQSADQHPGQDFSVSLTIRRYCPAPRSQSQIDLSQPDNNSAGARQSKVPTPILLQPTTCGIQPCEDQQEAQRSRCEHLDYEPLTDAIRQAMIGSSKLLPAQQQALSKLAQHRSTLCVMATGRGKSLIFHIHAAREALAHHKISVFVYPLRALVADQLYHLRVLTETFGLHVRILTGETRKEERDDIFAAAINGLIDIVLTTPEFLAIHARRFAQLNNIGFVVIDEAHHAAHAKGGHRSAYTQLPRVLQQLGNPTCLALSATAHTDDAQEICHLLSIDASDVLIDDSVRTNLQLRDGRDAKDRDAALVHIVSPGEKTIVYVNSREQSVLLARMLRHALPDLGHKILFYNAGLTRSERLRVEEAFRNAEISCIVATSAFGEGVNLPDVRHIVLYHMPFGATEFNQMSGRAGRDGKPASIHLVFGDRDARINERLLAAGMPQRDLLVELYKTLKALARSSSASSMALAQAASDSTSAPAASGDVVASSDVVAPANSAAPIRLSNAELAEAARQRNPRIDIDERSVSAGVAIFSELQLLKIAGYGSARQIFMDMHPSLVDLQQSSRYLEGLHAHGSFEEFRDWVLRASTADLLDRINRPIIPDFGYHV